MTSSAQEQVKEDVAVETKGESPEERFLKETPTRLLPEGDNRNPVLGAVRINFLVRKNGNTNFDKWFDGGYKTEAVRNEMKVALIKNGCPEVNVGKFLLNLEMKAQHPESKDTSPAGIAYDELKYLVEKANKQKESYDEAMGESDEFKSNVVLDSMKNFWHAEVVEGFETKPLTTVLKMGGALALAYLAWQHIVKANKWEGKAAWIGAGAGALYLLNGYIPHAPGNDDEKTGLDFIFPPKVDSPAMQWFLNKVGMGGSREKVSIMMRIANVKMDKLIGLYQQSSNGEIDIGELIDDPNLSEKEIAELQKLNTYRMRTALYKSISETVKLAGVDSTEELRRLFKTETLLSVIMQLYSEQPAGQSVAAIESGADSSMTDSDRRVESVTESRNEPNGINVLIHDDRIWVNSYPFKYKIENDNVVFLNDNGQPIPTISPLPLTGDNQVAYEKSLTEAKTFAESAAKAAIAKEFKVTVDKVQYTGTSWSVVGEVPAKPTIGLDAPTNISLSVHFLPNGQVKLDNHEGEVNVQEALIKEALAEKISGKGLSFATGNKIEIKSYDTTNGYIEAIAKDTSIKLKYEAGKYLFVSADWTDGRLLDSYKDGMTNEVGGILDTELKDLKINGELLAGFNLISNKLGVDSDEYKEFRKLYESKGAETGRLFAGLVSGLNQDGTDLDIRISESRTKVIQDLRASLQSISANFNSLIQTKDAKISESQFRADYIAKLQEAGISSGEYRTKFNEMMAILNKTDYRGNDRLNNTYYEVKTRAVQLYFDKTGRFANNTSLSGLESAYVDNVKGQIEGALNSALNEGQWIDDVVDTGEADKYFAKVRENIPDYGASSVNTPPSSPETQKTDPKALEVHKEQLDTKEKAFSECKRYVGAHFDSLKEVVQAQNVMAQKPSLFEGMLGMLGSTSTGGQVGDNIKTQWDTLVDLKKDKIVGSLDQSGFYAFYDGFSTSGATDVADYITGYIKSEAEKCGVPQKTDEIKVLSKQSGNYEETYLSMLEKLTFIDGGNNLPTVDPSLDVQVTSLEAKAESQWNTGDTAGYQATISQLTTITNSPSYSGRQNAYKEYLRGSFIKMMNMPASAGQPTKDIFRQALSGMEKYDGTTWEKSDAGLYSRVAEMDRGLYVSGIHPSQIKAGYDVGKFMEGRYSTLVQMESNSGLNAYQKQERIKSVMDMEKAFLTVKKAFWNDVAPLNLSSSFLSKLGATEQSIHATIFSLKGENATDIPDAKKVELYRGVLSDYVLNQLKAGETSIDADDVKDQIVDRADSLGFDLDKGTLIIL